MFRTWCSERGVSNLVTAAGDVVFRTWCSEFGGRGVPNMVFRISAGPSAHVEASICKNILWSEHPLVIVNFLQLNDVCQVKEIKVWWFSRIQSLILCHQAPPGGEVRTRPVFFSLWTSCYSYR